MASDGEPVGDELLIQELKAFERGERPSPFGELVFTVELPAVSLQASAAKKAVLTAVVRAALAKYQFMLTGDVWFDVQWLVHEQSRYESDASPDIDNILKPLIDAVCGPDGILIDDCQVQAVGAHWIDWMRFDEQITVKIKQHHQDDWLPKSGLSFIRMEGALCLPLPGGLTLKQTEILLKAFENQFKTRRDLVDLGAEYYTARMPLSVQRVYHRSRIKGFPVEELAAVRARLGLSAST